MKYKITPYIYLMPALVWIFGIAIYPLYVAFELSMHKASVGLLEEFVGLKNYGKVLLDHSFWRAFMNSLIWTAGNLVIITILGLMGAIILNQRIKGRTLARTLILVPWTIPTIVIALMFRWILDPTIGVINTITETLGFGTLHLLTTKYAMITVIVINAWRFAPFAIVLILSSFQSIPPEIYESARIDGASGIKQFINITLPMINPIMKFVLIVSFMWIFNVFDMIWLITGGGPGYATETLPIHIYRKAFYEFRMDYAATGSILMLIFTILVAIMYFRLTKVKV